MSPDVVGWKAIAAALRVSVRTAQYFARRRYRPLPVRHGHRGVYSLRTALQEWVELEDMPYLEHLARQQPANDNAEALASEA